MVRRSRSLLEELGVKQPHVAVELNLEVVPRAQHAATALREGDRLEVVTLVGGGISFATETQRTQRENLKTDYMFFSVNSVFSVVNF